MRIRRNPNLNIFDEEVILKKIDFECDINKSKSSRYCVNEYGELVCIGAAEKSGELVWKELHHLSGSYKNVPLKFMQSYKRANGQRVRTSQYIYMLEKDIDGIITFSTDIFHKIAERFEYVELYIVDQAYIKAFSEAKADEGGSIQFSDVNIHNASYTLVRLIDAYSNNPNKIMVADHIWDGNGKLRSSSTELNVKGEKFVFYDIKNNRININNHSFRALNDSPSAIVLHIQQLDELAVDSAAEISGMEIVPREGYIYINPISLEDCAGYKNVKIIIVGGRKFVCEVYNKNDGCWQQLSGELSENSLSEELNIRFKVRTGDKISKILVVKNKD